MKRSARARKEGRITLSKTIRDELGIEEGDAVEIDVLEVHNDDDNDAALETFLEVYRNFEDVKDEVTPQVARKQSTSRVQLAHYLQVEVRR
ncbi:MAG: hypothetical protein MAG715_00402 [Methanonatronarchaeales archaeon]|nr:hypothetical protein [Methanonatronarchaeales archaeon]